LNRDKAENEKGHQNDLMALFVDQFIQARSNTSCYVYLFEQSGSFLNAPTAHPEERSDEGSQKNENDKRKRLFLHSNK